MGEATLRAALESMMRATADDATPIIRRLARIQAQAALNEPLEGLTSGERLAAKLREAAWEWRTGAAITLRGITLEPADLEAAATAMLAASPANQAGSVGEAEHG